LPAALLCLTLRVSCPALPGLQATVSAIVESKATEIAELRHQLQEAQLSVQVGG
jgi:hypothetical protein